MGDHDTPSTCLSSRKHDRDVRDTYLHYSGCLRDNERQKYFDSLLPHQQQRVTTEAKRILELRALFDLDDETREITEKFKCSLNAWRNARPGRPQVKREETPTWNANLGNRYTKPCKENGFGLSANMIFFKDSLPFDHELSPDKFPDQKISIEDLLYKKEDNTKNPLMKKCEEDEIRWFHLPGNNMAWVEEAIARHYNEERPEYDGLFRRPEDPSKTYMLLRPEFWRGQQHGGRHDAVHARHMRPRCDMISTDPENLEETPKNLVLFMPYLHWETDRRREHFEELMRTITEQHKEHEAKLALKYWTTENTAPQDPPALPITNGIDIIPDISRTESDGYGITPVPSDQPIAPGLPGSNDASAAGPASMTVSGLSKLSFKKTRTATEVIHEKFKEEIQTHPKSKFSQTKFAKGLKGGAMPRIPTKLGQTLYDAANLAEAMDCYHEEKLLKEYLHHNPPFHPRRTLDQSYYWTLKTTKRRDRDQVVYRATAPKKGVILCLCDKDEKNKKKGCIHSQENSRKIPRVVMVDQLWLWILEGKTIITSFPKRYGRNKPDPSAVHASIRRRLKVARKNEIRSAYDLALIIVDECAKVFFDRAKTTDRKPQVMDFFATAIGNVTNRQTIAYDHFWDTTQEASNVYKSADTVGEIEDKAKSLLDINPEGKLLREIKDVLDELHLLINIKSKQQRVLKELNERIQYMITRPLALAKETGMAKQKRVTGDGNEDANENSQGENEATRKLEAHKLAKAERDAKWTLQFAQDLITRLDDRVADLNNLKDSARHTERALDGLLGLKQQQASVVQAREAVRQAEETLRQGRSIMLFTVITIIFLPLSFATGIFSMNTKEYNLGPWTLHREVNYMFTISLAVILTSFILAFSSITRATISYFCDLLWTRFITSTGIYVWWSELKLDSQEIRKQRKEKTRKLKEDARARKQKRRKEKYDKREGNSGKVEGEGDNREDVTNIV